MLQDTFDSHMKISMAAAFPYIGSMYPSDTEALSQVFENELDAGAQHLYLVLEENSLSVIGDGHGLVPYMLPEDWVVFQEHIKLEHKRLEEAMRNKAIAPLKEDIRRKIQKISQMSFQYMMERIGESQKLFFGSKSTKGIRGIGSLAWIQYGKRMSMRSKPAKSLVDDFPEVIHPIWELLPSSSEEIMHGNTSYRIQSSKKQLVDPWGKPLLQGSIVEVSEINWNGFRSVGNIVEYLKQRFSDALRRGVEITVIDRHSKEGKAKRGGIEIYLKPAEYKGVVIYDKTLHLDIDQWKQVPFRIVLWYRPNREHSHQKDEIFVLRRGGQAFLLTDMPEFKEEFWKRIQGEIEYPFPIIEESNEVEKLAAQTWDSEQWTVSKRGLRNTPTSVAWIRKVLSIKKAVLEEMENADEHYRAAIRKQKAKGLGDILMQAVESLPAFQGMIQVRSHRSAPERQQVQKVQTTIQAKVTNEHGRGITDIQVTLRHENTTDTLITNQAGIVDFGKKRVGRYVMKVIVPAQGTIKVHSKDGDARYFETTKEKLGHIARFTLITGEQAPEKRKPLPRAIDVGFLPLKDAGDPWEQRLAEYGQIIINDQAEPIATWLGIGAKEEQAQQLIFAYCAAAIASYCFDGDKEFVLKQSSIILGRILEILQTNRRKKQKKTQ